MLAGPLRRIDRRAGGFQKLRVARFVFVAPLETVAKIPARFAMDPVRHVDPTGDLARPLAIPGQVFGEVPVRFRRVEAEALQDIDPHLLLLRIDGMPLERRDELVASDGSSAQANVNVPGLVIDAGADVVEFPRS